MNNLPVKQELYVFGEVTTEIIGDAFERQKALEGEFIPSSETAKVFPKMFWMDEHGRLVQRPDSKENAIYATQKEFG